MPSRVRGVLFDLDGTLYDPGPCFSAWARWFAHNRLGLLTSREAEEAVELLTALDAGGYGSKEEMFRLLKERYSNLTTDVSILTEAFRQDLLTHLPPLDEGTASVLSDLKDAGLPWGIVTNGSHGQLAKIRRLELDGEAACVIVSGVLGVRKPAPEIFRTAAAEIGVAPPDILFVGDDPVADVQGAARVGMQTAWLRRAREWPANLDCLTPNHSIDSLTELRLALWEGY